MTIFGMTVAEFTALLLSIVATGSVLLNAISNYLANRNKPVVDETSAVQSLTQGARNLIDPLNLRIDAQAKEIKSWKEQVLALQNRLAIQEDRMKTLERKIEQQSLLINELRSGVGVLTAQIRRSGGLPQYIAPTDDPVTP